jgi:hypothetical protein
MKTEFTFGPLFFAQNLLVQKQRIVSEEIGLSLVATVFPE